jgi:hypothetical protein
MEADYRFLSAGLYMSYMVYHATGEGVMSCIAVAGSKQAAEHLMKGKLPEHLSPSDRHQIARFCAG